VVGKNLPNSRLKPRCWRAVVESSFVEHSSHPLVFGPTSDSEPFALCKKSVPVELALTPGPVEPNLDPAIGVLRSQIDQCAFGPGNGQPMKLHNIDVRKVAGEVQPHHRRDISTVGSPFSTYMAACWW